MTAAVIIHVNSDEDLRKCHNIRTEIFVKEQGCSAEGEIDDYDPLPTTHHFLALLSTASIGTVRLHPYPSSHSTTCKLGRLAVLPQWRNSGYGRQLLSTAELYAKNVLGMERILLHAQIHKRNWYEKAGYIVVSEEVILEEGIEHVKMEKALKEEYNDEVK
ncbi:8411_t:CDS:2 [Paraglomus occultum]|uniref:8411_t:CDS:1 n=1 Tax=Paraglomus occultum TaxID=144539 RepID=A0A9N9G8H1_9GLOM|nr:8411_t:CDS:2 [Paraglomus occultum]